MKKCLIAGALAIVFIVPTVSLAQTTVPDAAKAALIQQLETLLASLIAQLQQMLAQQGSSVNNIVQNYDGYPRLGASTYTKNPPYYLNQGVQIPTLAITGFLPAGGSGGGSNYLYAGGNSDTSRDIMLEVKSSADYQSIVSQLNKNDYIVVFGLGQKNQPFTSTNLFGTHDVSDAVVLVQRIDKCQTYECTPGQTTTIFGPANPNVSVVPVINYPVPAPISAILLPPSCAITASPSSVSSGQQTKLSWTSTNATAGTLTNIGQLTSVNGSMWITPVTTTIYRGTFINGSGGITTNCAATVNVI